MEDDTLQSPSNMVPVALAVFGIVLGAAGLYFGLTANQRINPIDESVGASISSSAKLEKVMDSYDTQIAELNAQLEEQVKTISRLRVYSSQGEQKVKQLEQAVNQLASDLSANREQIVKTAKTLNEYAAAGFRAPSKPVTPTVTVSATDGTATLTADATPAVAGEATTYQIVAGDNFGKIATRAGVSVQAIMDANPGVDPRRLSIGQAIQIPAK